MRHVLRALGITLLLGVSLTAITVAAEDPGEGSYRLGERLLDQREFDQAAAAFGEVHRKFPDSKYSGDSFYWQAFALFRTNEPSSMRTALQVLREQRESFPEASTRRDAESLTARIDGALARQGDADAARRVAQRAEAAAPPAEPSRPASPARPSPPAQREPATDPGQGRLDPDLETRIAALNALLQMDSDRAVPILRRVLEKRTPETAPLRQQATFMIAQHETGETADILMDVARHDPSLEVRGDAVFWLHQVEDPRSMDLLLELARDNAEPEIQDKAVFALSQFEDPRAGKILRDLAGDRETSEKIRESAIFWLGQREDKGGVEYLMGLYEDLESVPLRDKVIFSVSQIESRESRDWLMERALDTAEDVDLRKQALFWLGQVGGLTGKDYQRLYRTFSEPELREQLIFAIAQSDSPEALEVLLEIARNDADPEMRKNAIFWLGQSDDPRALDLLEEVLSK